MALTATLSSLREQARFRADQVNSGFISDAELNGYINNSYAELYDLLVTAYGDSYYATSADTALVTGTQAYALPATFYKLLGVDILINGNSAITIQRINFNERNFYDNTVSLMSNDVGDYRYLLRANNIVLYPIPNSTDTLRIWYVPAITRLSADGDTVDGVNGWEEYIIIDAAIKMCIKEETDVQALVYEKESITKRILAMKLRDVAYPQTVSDVTLSGDNNYYGPY